MATPEPILRLGELMAALSLSTDAGMGLPFESGQRAAILAVRLGEAVGLSPEELRDAFYLGLLGNLGCAADAHIASEFFGGDEKKAAGSMAFVDGGPRARFMGALTRRVASEEALPQRAATVVKALLKMRAVEDLARAHCEVASAMALSCGFSSRFAQQIGQLFARWDGKGLPRALKGEAIGAPARVAVLARDAEVYFRRAGVSEARVMARKRRGRAYDPAFADTFVRKADHLAAALEVPSVFDAFLAAEPGRPELIAGERLERALRAIAALADLVSTYTRGHSIAVARLAEAAGVLLSLSDRERTTLRHAGYLHDLGRMGVPASLWQKRGLLTDSERERMRLHAHYTERILARPPALSAIGALASLDHERLDGSGYPRRVAPAALPPAARLLAAADVYVALTETRPHRPAYSTAAACGVLESEARVGRLCPEAVAAVLAAAGHRAARRPALAPAGLTDGEVEVLGLVALGLDDEEVSTRLEISRRVVVQHLHRVYDKLGISTRAAAALFAIQHDLLPPQGRHPVPWSS